MTNWENDLPYPSQGEPACWSWAPPEDPAELPPFSTLESWRFYAIHAGRCAICGGIPSDGHLVEDHDHATGMVRGLLCRSCNVREGLSADSVFIRYRRIHPAQMLDVYLPYTGRDWVHGWWMGDCPGDPYDLGPRPAEPWNPWTKDVPLDQPDPARSIETP